MVPIHKHIKYIENTLKMYVAMYSYVMLYVWIVSCFSTYYYNSIILFTIMAGTISL